MQRQGILIGVDLGGTKIEAIALSEKGDALVRRRVPTPVGSYTGTLNVVVGLVRGIESELGACGSVGIGTPGTLSSVSGVLKNANSTWLLGKDLKTDLSVALGREIRLANDANCFALSEATDGGGAGAEVVFGVIIGTGTGGGLVVRGQVWKGPNGIAGEWGHNPLPWPRPEELPGPSCYCGMRGCIETFLSGPGLSRDFREMTDRLLAPPAIVAAAERGEHDAEAALLRYEGRLARSLAHVINMLDPEVIILGGGMSNIDRLYRNVPAQWASYVFSDRVDTRLVPPTHGDSSGVRGAAWLWKTGAPGYGMLPL